MRKLFSFLIVICLTVGLCLNFSFAIDSTDTAMFSTEEFKETDPIPDISTALSKDDSHKVLSKDELIDIILNDDEFNSYLNDELENIYDSLVGFVMQKPEILKNFEDSLNITQPDEIRNFFEELITSADVKDCLISLLDDSNFYDVFKSGNLEALVEAFYETLTIWNRNFLSHTCCKKTLNIFWYSSDI